MNSTFIALWMCFFAIVGAQKRFVIRMDDIEDYYHSDVQASMLNFFMDKGIAISAGVIGNFVTGQDSTIFAALQRCVQLGVYKCALFNHGADASYTYGSATSTSEAYTRMKTCDDKIKALFPGYTVDLFVPHQNSWNQYTLAAAKQLGYAAVSASSAAYSNMQYDITTDPLQLSQHTTTGVLSSSGAWEAYPIASTVSECEAAAAKNQICVIMTHPHEFSAGAYTLAMLQELLDALANAGFTESINFRAIIEEIRPATVVPTIVPTFISTRTTVPTTRPSTIFPSFEPSRIPSQNPTIVETVPSTTIPSTHMASSTPPTFIPTLQPSSPPSFRVTRVLTRNPTVQMSATPSLRPSSKKRFSIRIDDIKDSEYASIQSNLLNTFREKGVAISVAIEGNSYIGQDSKLYATLQRCINQGDQKCDVLVQHSTTASTNNKNALTIQFQQAINRIKSLFGGVSLKVIIVNSWDKSTLEAVKSVGFSAVSGIDNANLVSNFSSNPIQLPQHTSTGMKNATTGNWTAKSTESIISDCDAAAARGEVCVIQVTANEFASGAYTADKVSELVSGLQAAGFTDSVTFSTIIAEVQGLSSPSNSNSNSDSMLTNPPAYVIALIVISAVLLVLFIGYITFRFLRREQRSDTITTVRKPMKGLFDLESVSTDTLMEFSVESGEDKSIPIYTRRIPSIEPHHRDGDENRSDVEMSSISDSQGDNDSNSSRIVGLRKSSSNHLIF